MRRSTKRRLASRFRYSKFAQLLIYSLWFRAIVIAVLLVGLVAGLLLPKIWNVAPARWTQEIRISGLDMVQAWSLGRTARRQDQAGQPEAALYSWGAAIANYPTKPSLSRGYLRTALQATNDAKLMQTAVRQADWLLGLTGAKPADVELAARLYDKLELPQAVLAVLRGQTNALPGELQRAVARALFDVGAYPAFEAQWQTNQALFESDPGLVLRRASIRDRFGKDDEAAAARRQIETAADGGTNRVIANRLRLLAAVNRREAGVAQAALNTLVELKADRLLEHAAFWRLLCLEGRATEAGSLIQGYRGQPRSVVEAAEFFDLAMASEQTRRADEVMAWSLEHHGYTAQMCSRQAAALARKQAWSDVRQLAVDIRLRPRLSPTLLAYSYFLEGQASFGENRPEQAQAAFSRLREFDYDDPLFALRMATDLCESGLATSAMPLLAALEAKLANVPEYWFLLSSAAAAQKNSVLLLRAAERLYALNTNNVVAASNYAAALAVQEAEPTLVLQLTSNLVNQFPESPAMNINYAAALLLNARVDEARAFLAKVDPRKLGTDEVKDLNFIALKAAVLARERARATELATKIDRSRLFPPQRMWLEAAERSFLQATNAPAAVK